MMMEMAMVMRTMENLIMTIQATWPSVIDDARYIIVGHAISAIYGNLE